MLVRRRGRGLVVALAIAIATVTACTGNQAPPRARSSSPPPARLTAAVSQYTIDEANGDLRFAITNVGTRPIRVVKARLDWSGFATPSTTVSYGSLAPGQSTGFAAKPTEAHCRQQPTDRPTVQAFAGGRWVSVPLRVTVPGLLKSLYRSACAKQALAAAATVDLVVGRREVVRAGSHYLPATVLIRRVGGNSGVQVLSLLGSVLLNLEPAAGRGSLPAGMAAGQSTARVPVLLGSGSRCDPHSLSQSSVTFLLSAVVRVDGQPALRVTFSVDNGAKRRLLLLIHTNCR
jgi:hypothetical protein